MLAPEILYRERQEVKYNFFQFTTVVKVVREIPHSNLEYCYFRTVKYALFNFRISVFN